MIAQLFNSAATFKRDTFSKLSFILLHQVDLVLTCIALSYGLSELNPFIISTLQSPLHLIAIKLAIPLIIAYLCPGKLLIPASLLLCLVIGWDIKELLSSMV